MNRKIAFGLTAAAITVAVAGTWMFVHSTHADGQTAQQTAEKTDTPDGVATVTTSTIKSGQVSQTVTAYGNVTAQPGSMLVLSAAIDCRVKHLRVTGGESVAADAPIIEIEPSPDARLQWNDARNGLEGAKKDAATVQQRFDLKLATNGELQTATRAVESAQLKFDDLTGRGAGDTTKTITADVAGMIGKVDVQEGQLIPAGGALVELVPAGQIEVRLGVEPEDAMLLRADQSAQLFPPAADEDEPLDAKIRMVAHRVNPESRLVDVFVKPSEMDGLLLDSFIRGELTTRTVSGLVVPHDAILPDDQGFSLFTVVDGHAVKHAVKVAVQNDKEAVITGDGLHEGDAVVITGNLELDDKDAVSATPATTAPTDAEGDK